MGLAWAYGKKPGEGLKGKIKTISAAALTTTRMLTHEGCDTTENAHGEKKKDVDRSAARGQQDGKKRFEAHPAGYMDGSVPVPAESKVFMTMPRRFGVRADGSRTEEGVKQLHESLVCHLKIVFRFLGKPHGRISFLHDLIVCEESRAQDVVRSETLISF